MIEATFGRPFEGDPFRDRDRFMDRLAEAEAVEEWRSVLAANAIARLFGD